MKYKLVYSKGVVEFSSRAEAIGGFAQLGFVYEGYDNKSLYHRKELQGAPLFSGLFGPMWDGDCIRYEDEKVNEALSR